MKKILLILVLAYAAANYFSNGELGDWVRLPAAEQTADSSDQQLQAAFDNRQSDLQIQGQGRVLRVLADDLEGSRHQRFLLQLDSGQTLLVAHNIDLAPRVANLRQGDVVVFYGEYEWNPQGGVIHWTHHDPRGRHPGGWLKHGGRTYQ